jgi:Holliday junction resolvase RusA-like endonuclease
MIPVLKFRVFWDPKPQPRPRAFGRKVGLNKFVVRAYDPGTAEGWKTLIAMAAKEFLPSSPLIGPIRLHVIFIFARPQLHYRANGALRPTAPVWHTHRPDRDNLEKAMLDALTTLGFWKDDCQVCGGEVMKRYTKSDERPGAIVIVSPLPAPNHQLQ